MSVSDNTTTSTRILSIAGSLRKESFNRKLIETAVRRAPSDVEMTIGKIDDIPLYNDDDYQLGFPDSVARLRKSIANSDAVLIATPEYNHSIPGVLKNALDWVSRPPDQPFSGKPVAVTGASPGRLGTARSQNHLLQVLYGMGALPISNPKVYVSGVHGLIGEDGAINDEKTVEFVSLLVVSLRDWAITINS